MWKRMTVGRKIALGFGIVLVLLAVLGISSVTGIRGMSRGTTDAIAKNHIIENLQQREIDHLNWANHVSALLTDDDVTELDVETDPRQCAFGKWFYSDERAHAEALIPGLKEILDAIEEPHRKLHESAVHIGECFAQADLELGNFLREKKLDHLAWTGKVRDALLDPNATRADVQLNAGQCALGKWLASPDVAELKRSDPAFAAALAAIDEPHRKLHESAREINALLAAGKRDEAVAFFNANTEKAAQDTLAEVDKIIGWHNHGVAGMQEAARHYATATKPALADVQKHLTEARTKGKELVAASNKAVLQSADTTQVAVTLVAGVSIVAGVALALLIARGIVKALKGVIEALREGSHQVAAASGQVASASQSLAEGSSEQAASIEETSSSIEEMSSMTRQNAANAQQANTLMGQTRELVGKSQDAMGRLAQAIGAIKTSSDDTAKIVKTIDEIAFQTNLLALNAAVEAARAGDAGKGFAVVAEEVRNLAQRAGEAARNTASLINDSVQNAENGVTIADETQEALVSVTESAQKAGDLVGEIAAASNEQSQGIDQVNTAVGQIDTVTQQNAANAEESASAAEELTAQAAQLDATVREITALVGGASTKRAPADAPQPPATAQHHPPHPPARRPAPQPSARPAPEDVLPLDSDVDSEKELAAF